MKGGKCLGILEIKGVELVLEQPEGDEVRTGQKALLPTSRGDLPAYLSPRHKSRAARRDVGIPWGSGR